MTWWEMRNENKCHRTEMSRDFPCEARNSSSRLAWVFLVELKKRWIRSFCPVVASSDHPVVATPSDKLNMAMENPIKWPMYRWPSYWTPPVIGDFPLPRLMIGGALCPLLASQRRWATMSYVSFKLIKKNPKDVDPRLKVENWWIQFTEFKSNTWGWDGHVKQPYRMCRCHWQDAFISI